MISIPSILIQSSFLFISTTIVVFYILKIANLSSFRDKNVEFDKKGALIYSITSSLGFTIIMALISIQTDKQLLKNDKK
jgi:hypothetical protein|uniref:Uncharacterized protein n=1 Tax=viral metagenome TaxID=1070528 RepID=A0A6C0J1F8_9ZZZZ